MRSFLIALVLLAASATAAFADHYGGRHYGRGYGYDNGRYSRYLHSRGYYNPYRYYRYGPAPYYYGSQPGGPTIIINPYFGW